MEQLSSSSLSVIGQPDLPPESQIQQSVLWGPAANPSCFSVKAGLHPAQVARETNKHRFSLTESQSRTVFKLPLH